MFQTVQGFRKADLQIVLKEIGENVPVVNTIASLKELIEDSKVYKKCPEFVEEILHTTIADRQLEEKRVFDQEIERKLKQEREAKQESERITFEYEKMKMDHELKLARIRMQERDQDCFKKPKSKASKSNETSAISSDSSDENDNCRKRKRPVSVESSEESLDENEALSRPSKQSSLPRLLPGSAKEVPKEVFSDLQVFTIEDVTSENKDTTQTALFHGMFKYMERLNSKMDELNEKLDHLLDQSVVKSEEDALQFLPDWLELPLMTETDLKIFNERLKADRHLSAVMVRYLHSVGNGRSPSAYVLSLTKKLLDRELALQYSRLGRKGKKSFSDYSETLNVLLSAAAMKYTHIDKERLSEVFGRALAGAPDWNGRKPRLLDSSNEE